MLVIRANSTPLVRPGACRRDPARDRQAAGDRLAVASLSHSEPGHRQRGMIGPSGAGGLGMKMGAVALGLAASAALSGCAGDKVSYEEFQATRHIAMDAHREAESAMGALDSGTSSGTIMGYELDDALQRIEALEARVSAICIQAPHVC